MHDAKGATTMTSYRHHIRGIRGRTVNGYAVWQARMFDEGDMVRWQITDIYGREYVDGGNFPTADAARVSLREALDPIRIGA
jgi:hypothetical protein